MWKKKVQQISETMHTLREEKEPSVREILKQETNWTEVRSQLVELLSLQPKAGPTEAE
jgi:hypothetical protein